MNRFELFIILMLVAILGTAAFVVIGAVRDDAAARPCEAPTAGWEPPNLQLCPEDMTLWNCIRNASYRSDL